MARAWTTEETEFLRKNINRYTRKQLAQILNRSLGGTIKKITKLGIRLDPKVREQRLSTNWFKKGMTPWNKGIYIRNSPATEFKKGNIPPQCKPVGTISLRRHKKRDTNDYLYIKLGKGYWKLYHHHIWETANGPVPDGYVLSFKNGNTMDVRLDNLELISKSERAERNLRTNVPAEKLTDRYVASTLKIKLRKYEKLPDELRPVIEIKRKQLLLRKILRRNYNENNA